MPQLLIYGATGYSGRLCAREAARRGLTLTIAGRSSAKLAALSAELDVDAQTVDVDDGIGLEKLIGAADCVLNTAGPFAGTAPQIIDACLRKGVSYIDITGEFGIFRLAHSLDQQAKLAGAMLMPGVGWDIVPSDCLAAHTARRVERPAALRIGLSMPESVTTRGTLRTIIEQGLATTFVVRRGGELVQFDAPPPSRKMRFGYGEADCQPLTTGDVLAAYLSTGIPDIDVYLAVDQGAKIVLPEGGIDAFPEGPTAEMLARWRAFAVAEVVDSQGRVTRSEIETNAGYAYTAQAAIEIASRIMNGDFLPGYQTPATAYGASLATDIGGRITDYPVEG